MPTEKTIRKLRAILSADVKGYSLLMADNELATIDTLKSYRQKMTSLIQQHQGRVVDSPGDNMLAEFASSVDAVNCAVKIQEELKERNAKLSEDRKMQFRIGINIGDVVQDADRIYGDGVNVAARIEGLAEPGGICISRGVCDHVKKKLKLGFEYLGEHSVKNIAEPVRVYKVLMEPEYVGEVIGEERPKPKQWRFASVVSAVVLIVVAGAFAVWHFYFRPPPIEAASIEKMAFSLPEKPSIAILPFDNMSTDPEQVHFCDGITDEIITALAKIPDLFVIARNSTFVYKGKPVKIKQVSEELGVQYVLEGGIRRVGDQIRITAQLIDAIKGHHLWAERYDGKIVDIFDLQDTVTQKIVAELAVKLTPEKEQIIADRGTKNLEAYDAFLQGLGHAWPQNSENLGKAITYFKKAIELDPDFVRGHGALYAYYSVIRSRFYDKELGISDINSLIQKHIKLAFKKNPSAMTYMAVAWGNIFSGQIEKGKEHIERAFALAPNNAKINQTMGAALIYTGRPGEAIVISVNYNTRLTTIKIPEI